MATKLEWNQTTQWANFPELGSIYTQPVRIDFGNDYIYDVEFAVEDGRQLGILFCKVEALPNNPGYTGGPLVYSMGQFYTNEGAMKFAQFALDHFAETENWAVCGGFQYVDIIDGEYVTLDGEELVSELI